MGISQVIASSNVQGSDVQLTATGDVQTASGDTYTQQRILRRLMTAPGSYIWHPSYGAGLPLYIGQPLSDALFNQLKALIISQILQEATVSPTPTPEITLNSLPYSLFGNIKYTDAVTNAVQVLSFNYQK